MLRTNNDSILVNYGTFVVALKKNLPALNTSPFGVDIRWFIDPTNTESAIFLNALQKLDGLTFGPEGMPMDKWVFYDCAEIPGFIYGFAMPGSELSEREAELFGVPKDYAGPVPISMYIAIPMLEAGCWLGHNLASLNPVLPDRKLGFLATLTKAMGLKAFGVEQCFGATQWNSRALNVHTRFGPLELLTTYTPAHSFSATLTYRFDVEDNCLRAAMGDSEAEAKIVRPAPDFFLGADNEKGMRQIQSEIERGARFAIAGPASWIGDQGVHPIKRIVGVSD
jgi:hypothetical protein